MDERIEQGNSKKPAAEEEMKTDAFQFAHLTEVSQQQWELGRAFYASKQQAKLYEGIMRRLEKEAKLQRVDIDDNLDKHLANVAHTIQIGWKKGQHDLFEAAVDGTPDGEEGAQRWEGDINYTSTYYSLERVKKQIKDQQNLLTYIQIVLMTLLGILLFYVIPYGICYMVS